MIYNWIHFVDCILPLNICMICKWIWILLGPLIFEDYYGVVSWAKVLCWNCYYLNVTCYQVISNRIFLTEAKRKEIRVRGRSEFYKPDIFIVIRSFVFIRRMCIVYVSLCPFFRKKLRKQLCLHTSQTGWSQTSKLNLKLGKDIIFESNEISPGLKMCPQNA